MTTPECDKKLPLVDINMIPFSFSSEYILLQVYNCLNSRTLLVLSAMIPLPLLLPPLAPVPATQAWQLPQLEVLPVFPLQT